MYSLKVGNLRISTGKKFSPYHCKTKIAAPNRFFAQIPIFHIFQRKESFWKSAEHLWWYSVFFDTVYSLNVGNFEFFQGKKFSPYHCKTKIAAPIKFLAQIPIFHMFQRKESFWNSAEYLWWYSLFSDTVYSLKVGNYEFFHQKKVFALPLQN